MSYLKDHRTGLIEDDAHPLSITVHFASFSLLKLNWKAASCLTSSEKERVNSFTNPIVARQYAFCRSLLRHVLAQVLKCAPHQIPISFNEFGKPQLSDLKFNLSHNANCVAIAVACSSFDGEIGVDIEAHVSDFDELKLAELCFSNNEYQQLLKYPPGLERRLAFTRGWTRKESVVKAMGIGLQAPLKEFDVSLKPIKSRATKGSLFLDSRIRTLKTSQCDIIDLGSRMDSERALSLIYSGRKNQFEITTRDITTSQFMTMAA